ncbi:MAG: conjugal transfer protein MobB [Rikenellaceae bacterium]
MVAKISVGNSLYGALAYNQSKVDIDSGKVLLAHKIIENEMCEIDMRTTLQSFNLYLANNDKTKKTIVHISLNPHPDDKLTDEQMTIIAQEYMEKMGYGAQPYVIYKHNDIERGHIHIVTLNVDSTGKKISDSNNYHRNNKVCREIEQKYGLNPAERKKKAETFNFKKVDIDRGNIKIQIGNVIKPIAASYHFQSFNEYRTILAHYNIHVEESKGVRGGNSYAGLIYYAMNEQGGKASNPFKSSLYGKSVGYISIFDKMEKHKETIKSKRLNHQTAERVRSALGVSPDRDSFRDELSKLNIDVIFRDNAEGRLYGATFIDHDNQCVFNGSLLGRDLAANALSDWFENPQITPQDHTQGVDPNAATQMQTPNQDESRDDFENSNSLGGLFDLPIDDGIDDPEEESFRKSMQRKKKRKGRGH